MKSQQYQPSQKNSCSSPLTNTSNNGDSTASERTYPINDFTKEIQIYQNVMIDKFGQNKAKQRNLDLNSINNINGILGTSRSTSRNHSLSQPDSNKFISFKKIFNFDQKQQRNSISRKGRNSLEEEKLSRNNICLTSSTKFTPNKKKHIQLEQQSKITKSANVKTIKLQLEKQKNSRENSLTRYLSKNSRNQSYTDFQIIQSAEHEMIQDQFDLTPKKYSQREQNDKRQRFNSIEKSKVSPRIHSPKINSIFPNTQLNNKQDITVDQYLNKVQTKLDFTKVDQKLDKNQDTIKQNRNISQLYQNSDEYAKNIISKPEKSNTGIQFNKVDLSNKNQQIEQNIKFSEFELLEQSIFKEEQENKEKILFSKGLKSKKYSNQSSLTLNNQYCNVTPTTISLKQGDSDFGAFDFISAFGGDTENSINLSIKLQQKKISNLNQGLSTQQSSQKSTNNQDTEQPSVTDSHYISSEIDYQIQNSIKSKNNINRNRNVKEQNSVQQKQQQILNETLQNHNRKQSKLDESDNMKGTNAASKDMRYSYSYVLNRNISPTSQQQKNQLQLNQIPEISKNLYNQSQETQDHSKQKQNIFQLQSDQSQQNLNTQSIIPQPKQLSPSKLSSLTKLHIPSKLLTPTKLGSLSQRQQEKQNISTVNLSLLNNNYNNQLGNLSARTKKNQSITSIFIADKSNRKQTPLKQENKKNQIYQINQFDKSTSKEINSAQIEDKYMQRYPQNMNHFQNIQSKTENDEQNIKQLNEQNFSSSKVHEQKLQKYIVYNNKLSESQNLIEYPDKKSGLTSNQNESYANYNFINEKSNILNKISGSYKYNQKSSTNIEKNCNSAIPSKSAITRSIQLNTMQLENYQIDSKDSIRKDTLNDRKQTNLKLMQQKQQEQSAQPSQLYSQQSQINSYIIDKVGDLSQNEFSYKPALQTSKVQFKDTINSLSKFDVKESTILTKSSTIQANLTNGKLEKQRSSLNNTSNTSLALKQKNSHDLKEVQIIPSQNSSFNFKPSFFTPLNFDDISDYIEIQKRNVSPHNIKK